MMKHLEIGRTGLLIMLMSVAVGLHAQDSVVDRFWQGTDPVTIDKFFPDERTASHSGAAILDEPIVIQRRGTPFARIEPNGEVVLLGTRKGWLVPEGEGLMIMRDGQVLGRITPDGSIVRGELTIGRADAAGYLYDAAGDYRGNLSSERVWIDGFVWGFASPLATPEEFSAVAAFLFFFTELPEVWSE